MNNHIRTKNIISSISSSLENKNYFAALANSLIIVDICSKMYNPKENEDNKRYKQWLNAFLIPQLKKNSDYLSANNIWFLRCAMLHQGSSDPSTNRTYQKYGEKKVKDIVPTFFPEGEDYQVLIVDQGEEYPTLFFDINFFCESILKTVSEWINVHVNLVEESDIRLFSIAHVVSNGDKLQIFRI